MAARRCGAVLLDCVAELSPVEVEASVVGLVHEDGAQVVFHVDGSEHVGTVFAEEEGHQLLQPDSNWSVAVLSLQSDMHTRTRHQ